MTTPAKKTTKPASFPAAPTGAKSKTASSKSDASMNPAAKKIVLRNKSTGKSLEVSIRKKVVVPKTTTAAPAKALVKIERPDLNAELKFMSDQTLEIHYNPTKAPGREVLISVTRPELMLIGETVMQEYYSPFLPGLDTPKYHNEHLDLGHVLVLGLDAKPNFGLFYLVIHRGDWAIMEVKRGATGYIKYEEVNTDPPIFAKVFILIMEKMAAGDNDVFDKHPEIKIHYLVEIFPPPPVKKVIGLNDFPDLRDDPQSLGVRLEHIQLLRDQVDTGEVEVSLCVKKDGRHFANFHDNGFISMESIDHAFDSSALLSSTRTELAKIFNHFFIRGENVVHVPNATWMDREFYALSNGKEPGLGLHYLMVLNGLWRLVSVEHDFSNAITYSVIPHKDPRAPFIIFEIVHEVNAKAKALIDRRLGDDPKLEFIYGKRVSAALESIFTSGYGQSQYDTPLATVVVDNGAQGQEFADSSKAPEPVITSGGPSKEYEELTRSKEAAANPPTQAVDQVAVADAETQQPRPHASDPSDLRKAGWSLISHSDLTRPNKDVDLRVTWGFVGPHGTYVVTTGANDAVALNHLRQKVGLPIIE